MTTADKRPFCQYGFWWWYDPERRDWFVGCSPAIGKPAWWKEKFNAMPPDPEDNYADRAEWKAHR